MDQQSQAACLGSLSSLQCGELGSKLMKIMPSYMVKDCHVCTLEDRRLGLKSVIRLPINNKDDILHFIEEFSKMSYTTWRVSHTSPGNMSAGRKNLFWCSYNCQSRNRTNASNKHKKHSNCSANMSVTVKRVPKHCRSKDPHMPDLPTVIVLNFEHNHDLFTAEALKFRDVAAETEARFRLLFKEGHTPSSALKTHKHDLFTQHDKSDVSWQSDRSICPDLQWCYRLYYKIFNKSSKDLPAENELPSSPDNEDDCSNSAIDHSDSDSETCSPVTPVHLESWYEFAESIAEKIVSQPEVFDFAVGKFLSSCSRIQTDSELASALCTFASSAELSVQSTALAQTQCGVDGGTCLQPGKRPKTANVAEHGYHKTELPSSRSPEPLTSQLLPPPRKKSRCAT